MERLRQVETLIRQIEDSADPHTRAALRELVAALLEFHGAGVERMLEIVRESGEAGEGTVRTMARDPLVSSVLLLYGQHPDDFETRVRRAVDSLRNVELAGTEGFVVRLKTTGAAPREAIEQAIYSAAPETAGLEIEGPRGADLAFVPLESLVRASP